MAFSFRCYIFNIILTDIYNIDCKVILDILELLKLFEFIIVNRPLNINFLPCYCIKFSTTSCCVLKSTKFSDLQTKVLKAENKRFYLDVKENSRGRFLKITEVTFSLKGTRSIAGWESGRSRRNFWLLRNRVEFCAYWKL